MPDLNGSSSSFYESQIVDDWEERLPRETITSSEWNELGDAQYDLEHFVKDLGDTEKDFRLNQDSFFWAGNLDIEFQLARPHQLSVTGVVLIPTEVAEILNIDYPLNEWNLVKAQVVLDNPSTYGNMTSAIWIPSNWRDRYAKLSTGAYKPTTDPIWRTIYVSLYFDGMEPPQNLNNLGISLSVFITAPETV